MPRPLYLISLTVLVLGALLLRLPNLGNRPMHGDESVHALKFKELWEKGTYHYDANEFHGPTPYYAALPVIRLLGRHSFVETREADYRLVPVLAGVGLLLLLGLLGDALGRKPILWAALLTAVSPAMVFYSRYYIQEMLFACFLLGLIACGWRYSRSHRVGWVIGAGAFAGLVIASKETSVINFAALGMALAHTVPRKAWGVRRGHLLLGAGVALVVACLFLSGFLTNLAGPVDYLRSYAPWFGRAKGVGLHRHPWDWYLSLLAWHHSAKGPWWSEGLILALAAVGLVVALTRRKPGPEEAQPSFARFLALYTVLLTAAYSAIPYKTPWCVLSFLDGMVLLGGIGAAALVAAPKARWARTVVAVLLLAGCGQLAAQAYRTSFVYEADARNPYVYAQTVPEINALQKRVEELAAASPEGDNLLIKVYSVDGYYWPLPWTLRRFHNVGYWTALPADAAAPVVIASPEFDEELTKRLDATHLMTGFYGIRPGVLLQLWVRMDVWEAYLKKRGPAAE
ncbi:MAG TPA: flippase activity-associated protein Agl23 [Armatimonadota bacterium]|jgi:uncharacterized protein (TIGR03663 family)